MTLSNDSPLGVYVHIPFCATRCDYCAFATWTEKEHLISEYVDACCAHIASLRNKGQLNDVTTVFIGGGTPSLIGGTELARLVRALPVTHGGEVTVECNPESTNDALLSQLHDAGVTRLSLGVQSIHQHVLNGLGRDCTPQLIFDAIETIQRSGFTDFNVDLIFGGAGETDAEFAETVSTVLSCTPAPTHVSAYALSIEAGTPLAISPDRHPDEDVLAYRYEICDEMLSASGRTWYEVSNWALPGHECRHNLGYWRQGNYVAIGSAAHGHENGHRYRNITSPERYINALQSGKSPVAASEYLTDEVRARERLELSLRTTVGIPDHHLAHDLAIEGLVDRHDGRAVLTRSGRLLLNEVAMRITVDEIAPNDQEINHRRSRQMATIPTDSGENATNMA